MLQRTVRILFLLILCLTASAKTVRQPDSLDKLLAKGPVSERIRLLCRISSGYLPDNPAKALEYAKLAVPLAERQNDIYLKIAAATALANATSYGNDYLTAVYQYLDIINMEKSLKKLRPDSLCQRYGDAGYCFGEINEYEKSVNCYLQAYHLAESIRDTAEMATNLNNLGASCKLWGKYGLSIFYMQKALDLDKKNRDTLAISTDLNNIGKIYEAWGRYEEAIRFYESSLNIEMKTGNQKKIAGRLSNRGSASLSLKKFSEAFRYLEQSLAIERKLKNEEKIGVRLHGIGKACSGLKDYNRAGMYFTQALEIFNKLGKDELLAQVLNDLGDLELARNRTREAISFYYRSLTYARKIDARSVILEDLKDLFPAEKKTGRYDRALACFEEYASLKDSVFSENNAKLINEFNVRYQTEKKEKEIGILTREREIQDLRIRRDNLLKTLYFSSALLLLVLALVMLSRYRYKQRINKVLEEKNRQLQVLNSTKDKFFTIIAHDLKNPLSAFRSISQNLEDSLYNITKEEIHYFISELSKSSNMLYELLQNLLQWAVSQTDGLRFEPGPVDLVQVVSENFSVLQVDAARKNIDLKLSRELGIIAFADRNMVSTVLRNLLSNGIKFTGNGGEVSVGFRDNAGHYEVTVTDTGTGISPDDLAKLFRIDIDNNTIGNSEEKGTGLGLILCHELVEKNGGRIWAESIPGKGSSFKFTLPKHTG